MTATTSAYRFAELKILLAEVWLGRPGAIRSDGTSIQAERRLVCGGVAAAKIDHAIRPATK